MKASDRPNGEGLIGRYEGKRGFVRADKADGYTMAGYINTKTIPEPEQCPYCGRLRYYYGMELFGKIVRWMDEPEACICPEGQEEAGRIKAEKEAKQHRKEQEERAAEAQERINFLIGHSGMRARFLTRTFSQFTINEMNKAAYNAAKAYVDKFDAMMPHKGAQGQLCPPESEKNGIIFSGSYGTGKTHLAAAIANELMNRGRGVVCMTMIDLLDRIRSTFNVGDEVDERDVLDIYERVPLLIIDDLGSEQPTEWGAAMIFKIINARYEAYMPMIVTTNYGSEELIMRMTPKGGDGVNAEKTLDRLREMCAGIVMNGQSRRAI